MSETDQTYSKMLINHPFIVDAYNPKSEKITGNSPPTDGGADEYTLNKRNIARRLLLAAAKETEHNESVIYAVTEISQNDPHVGFYLCLNLLRENVNEILKENLLLSAYSIAEEFNEADKEDAIFRLLAISYTPYDVGPNIFEGPVRLEIESDPTDSGDQNLMSTAINLARQGRFHQAREIQQKIINMETADGCSLEIDQIIIIAAVGHAKQRRVQDARHLQNKIIDNRLSSDCGLEIDQWIMLEAIELAKQGQTNKATDLGKQIDNLQIKVDCLLQIDSIITSKNE